MNIPKFQNEAEEAKWWADHQDELAGEFERAAKEGRLGRGTASQQRATTEQTKDRGDEQT